MASRQQENKNKTWDIPSPFPFSFFFFFYFLPLSSFILLFFLAHAPSASTQIYISRPFESTRLIHFWLTAVRRGPCRVVDSFTFLAFRHRYDAAPPCRFSFFLSSFLFFLHFVDVIFYILLIDLMSAILYVQNTRTQICPQKVEILTLQSCNHIFFLFILVALASVAQAQYFYPQPSPPFEILPVVEETTTTARPTTTTVPAPVYIQCAFAQECITAAVCSSRPGQENTNFGAVSRDPISFHIIKCPP